MPTPEWRAAVIAHQVTYTPGPDGGTPGDMEHIKAAQHAARERGDWAAERMYHQTYETLRKRYRDIDTAKWQQEQDRQVSEYLTPPDEEVSHSERIPEVVDVKSKLAAWREKTGTAPPSREDKNFKRRLKRRKKR